MTKKYLKWDNDLCLKNLFLFSTLEMASVCVQQSEVSIAMLLWSLVFLESEHKMLYVYKTNIQSVGNRPGAAVKWGEGGNCHIKRKEFKIKLIFPPLHRCRMSMLHLVQHTKHLQRQCNLDKDEGSTVPGSSSTQFKIRPGMGLTWHWWWPEVLKRCVHVRRFKRVHRYVALYSM